MVGVRAPDTREARVGQRRFCGAHHFFRCALGARHFADGLLGEDRREIKFPMRGQMARCRQPEPVAVAKGFFQSERNGFGRIQSAPIFSSGTRGDKPIRSRVWQNEISVVVQVKSLTIAHSPANIGRARTDHTVTDAEIKLSAKRELPNQYLPSIG